MAADSEPGAKLPEGATSLVPGDNLLDLSGGKAMDDPGSWTRWSRSEVGQIYPTVRYERPFQG
jgi:hypothetical protein